MKKLIATIFLICSLAFVIYGGASALYYGNDTTSLWLVPNSGSSVDLDPRDGYVFQDIKGYPFGLFYGDQIETGIGTLVPVPTPGGGDNGLIYNTVIERAGDSSGSDIKISFKARPGVAQARVWRLSGTGVQYSTTDTWVPVGTHINILEPRDTTDTVWLESSNPGGSKVAVSDGNNAYYRVVPEYVEDPKKIFGTDLFGTPYNARTVGKVDVFVQRKTEGISFYSFSVPLIPQSGDLLDAVFSPNSFVSAAPTANKLEADQIREWDGANWTAYFKSSNGNSWKRVDNVDTAAKYIFSKGYVLRLQKTNEPAAKASFYVSTVGLMLPASYESNVAYSTDPLGLFGTVKYTAFGNPKPVAADFSNAFMINARASELMKLSSSNKLEADQVRNWDAATGNWLSWYLAADNTWKMNIDDKPANMMELGKGYVFRKADNSTKGEYIWKY